MSFWDISSDHKHLALHYLGAKKNQVDLLSMSGYLSHRNLHMVNYMDIRVQILRHWTSIKLVISIQTLGFLLTEKPGLRKSMLRDRQWGSYSGTPTAGFSGQRKSQGLRGRYQNWTHNIVLRYLARGYLFSDMRILFSDIMLDITDIK